MKCPLENPDPLAFGGGGGIVTDNGKKRTREFVTSSTPIAVSTVTQSTQSERSGLLEETTGFTKYQCDRNNTFEKHHSGMG